jgi:hypothetical protein
MANDAGLTDARLQSIAKGGLNSPLVSESVTWAATRAFIGTSKLTPGQVADV